MWKKLMSKVDLEEPTSIMTKYTWDVRSRKVKQTKDMWQKSESCSPHWSPPTRARRDRVQHATSRHDDGNLVFDMQRRAHECVERFCDLANTTANTLDKSVCSLFWMTSNSKKDELVTVGGVSDVCSQVLFSKKALYPARHGRPDLLWTVNYLTRSVTKWNRACGTRLAGSISHIHHTWNHRQYCHVGNKASECKLVPFHDQDFAGDMTDSKFTSEGVLCVLGSQTCVSVSRSCEKQTGVSQSSTEAENTSLMLVCAWKDPSLSLWEHSHWLVRTIRSRRPAAMSKTMQTQRSKSDTTVFSGDFDFVTPNTHICSKDKRCYDPSDHQRPEPQHESRFRNLQSWSWLFFIASTFGKPLTLKYVNTAQQSADVLTKGSFSQECWIQLTHFVG